MIDKGCPERTVDARCDDYKAVIHNQKLSGKHPEGMVSLGATNTGDGCGRVPQRNTERSFHVLTVARVAVARLIHVLI